MTTVDVASGKRGDVAVDGVAPAWSPGGRTIAFVDLDDGTAWGSAPNGADRHRLLPAAVHGVRWLAWSPDGRQLAFTTDNGIYVARPDGVDPGRTVVAAAFPSRPSFSPDGRELTYAATTGIVASLPRDLRRRRRRHGPAAAHDRALRQRRPGLAAGGTVGLTTRRSSCGSSGAADILGAAMSRRRALLLATAVAAVLGASTAPAVGSGSATAPAGEIVFTSDRASADPGEIYALAPGVAPRDISRSPYVDAAMATARRAGRSRSGAIARARGG